MSHGLGSRLEVTCNESTLQDSDHCSTTSSTRVSWLQIRRSCASFDLGTTVVCHRYWHTTPTILPTVSSGSRSSYAVSFCSPVSCPHCSDWEIFIMYATPHVIDHMISWGCTQALAQGSVHQSGFRPRTNQEWHACSKADRSCRFGSTRSRGFPTTESICHDSFALHSSHSVTLKHVRISTGNSWSGSSLGVAWNKKHAVQQALILWCFVYWRLQHAAGKPGESSMSDVHTLVFIDIYAVLCRLSKRTV